MVIRFAPSEVKWYSFATLLLLAILYLFFNLNATQKRWFGFTFIFLFGLIYIVVHSSTFQTWLVKKVTVTLSKNLRTKVSIRHVDFELFNKMLLQGTLVLDKKSDTLLYAGTAKVNITDWFFLKDNIVLKYAGLDDGFINLNRRDSVWNYQFLVDYFSGPKNAKKNTDKSDSLALDIKIIELNRFKILQRDEWIGTNTLVALNKLELYTDDFDLDRSVITINTLDLDHPVFSQYDYKGLRPRRSTPTDTMPPGLPEVKPGLQWNAGDWVFAVKNLEIKEGTVVLDQSTVRPAFIGQFDDKHINFSSINANIKNFEFIKDTLRATFNLTTKERSGLQVKKLAASLRFDPHLMEFSNLDLITNRSHLKDYYAMRYNNFGEDVLDFIEAVSLEGNFRNSEISSDDLAFFISDVKDWKRKFIINGNIKGKVSNLSAKNLTLQAGKENYFAGDFYIRGLPDINETYLELRAKEFRTSYAELTNLFPGIKTIATPNLRALGSINFNGAFTGFVNDFVTYGTLKTDLGTISTDINMKFPDKGLPVYNGKIVTSNFKLGKFINSGQIGSLSFNGAVSGNGFSGSNINIGVDGIIQHIEFNEYNYQNIVTKGKLSNRLFTGFVSVDDPNLKIDSLRGTINFKSKEPSFNFEAGVSKFNLKNLHFTKDSFSLTGKFNLNFTGDNIDNFLGSAGIYNAILLKDGQQLSFDSLIVNSSFSDGKKYLTLQTNELEASVAGNFKILELPDAFQLFLNRYYPVYINNPRRNIQNQDFVFNIKTRNVSDYILLFNKNLKGFDNSEISGNLNLSQNTLNVVTSVPAFSFGPTNFINTAFTARGTFDTLDLKGNIEDIVINDSLHFPGTLLSVVAHNDISDVSIKTSASQTLTEADLSARIQTLSDGFNLYFNPSSFVINNKKWILEKGGGLSLNKKLMTASEVKFVHDDQQLTISTEPSSTSNSNDVLVDVKKINIGDFMPFVLKDPKLEGSMTGNITIADPFKKLMVDFDTQIERFYFENDSIGILKIKGNYTSASGDAAVNLVSDNDPYNFTANMAYKAKDSTGNQLKGSIRVTHSNIHILQKYLSSVFSDMTGNASGELNISGTANAPKITGSATFNDATVTIDYTKCKYIIGNNSILQFNTDEIDFGSMKLRDTLNYWATLSGKLYHNFFDDFFFNELNFKTDKVNGNAGKFVLLNTTQRDNKQFYGNLIGDAELSINGPLSNLRMTIRGEPTDSSHIYLPTGETAETGKIDYIDFIKFGREMKSDFSLRQETNLKVDIEINANPFAKIDVILDETTKDIIKAQGTGKLNISAGTTDPLTIRGRYDIQEGQYTFNFQTFLKTPFSLQQGFIEWHGDPYLANLNIDAIYRAEKVDLSGIPSTSGYNLKDKGDVDIIFKLRGTLKDPSPDFEFQFPFGNPLKSDPIANEYLKTRFQADKNELNKQVTSLLLFNSFMPEQQRLFSTNNTGNFVTRTLGQIVSNTLSSSLNNWLQKLLKTDQVNLYTNINTSDFNFQRGITQKQIQNLGTFGFKTTFLKNRLLINFGGNVDYKLIAGSTNSNSNFLFTPDVSFEYLVTPDGKFRVVGFNRSDAGIGDIAGITRRNRTGILLSYRKDFDTFNELFGGRNK